jgi:hypothetical protein
MSRSIHKTVAQVARENTKAEIEDPSCPDIAALAKKRSYKRVKLSERRASSAKSSTGQPAGEN